MTTLAIVWLATVAQVPAPDDRGDPGADLRAARAALLRAAGRPDQDDPTLGERFVVLPEIVAPRPAGSSQPSDADLRLASDLLDLAREAAGPGRGLFGWADRCLRDAVQVVPDHPEILRMLGYIPHEGGWATPFAVEQLRTGKVLHERYGWVPGSWVEHLDRGELPGPMVRGDRPSRWLPADEANALRRSFREQPWTISTQHFTIRTNVPLDEAIRFGRELETLYDVFFYLLGDCLPRDRNPIARRLIPGITPPPSRRHEVWYFADREEYVRYFRDAFGRDESTSLGYAMPPAEAKAYSVPPRSYFYRDPDNPIAATATLFHEASHQLMFENGGTARLDRNLGHYWVWEALGTYFETARFESDGSLRIGGRVGPRLARARDWIVNEGRLVPTGQLVALGPTEFRRPESIHLHYAEAMALAVFLLNGDGGAYRDGFQSYIRQAYQGRLRDPAALAAAVGLSHEELDQRLVEFLSGEIGP
ncbi:MAG: hypothetical protein KatS3mg108_1289 [Isosphaeraceae bacterium]|nr:MAG: hypothetical protein KatS3mg108_1289 [Isosphaeraceae bacterium]